MWRRTTVVSCALAMSACTFGLGQDVTFVAENLELGLEGDMAEGGLVAFEEAQVQMLATREDFQRGVFIGLEGADGEKRLQADLVIDGDLGALCPGSRVEFERVDGEMVPVTSSASAAEMRGALESLRATMTAVATVGTTEPGVASRPTTMLADRLVLRSVELRGSSRARIEFESSYMVEGRPVKVEGAFDVARMEQDREVGWD